MGEALSVPGQAEGTDSDGVPKEHVLLAQLIQLLNQRQSQRHSLLLSDLGALLPGNLRQRVKDQGGLRLWLQRYPKLFAVSGLPGKDTVTLVLGQNQDSNIDPASVQEAPDAREGETGAVAGGLGVAGEPARISVGPPPSEPAPPAPGLTPNSAPSTTSATVAGQPNAGGTDSTFDEEIDGQYSLQLRGLPYRATVDDVRNFLGEHSKHLVADNPIHFVLNRDGRPSGFARVQFTSPDAAARCRDQLHLRGMDDRYVEVFLYSERPSRGRQRRGILDDGTGADNSSRRNDLLAEVQGITREDVVLELRSQMVEPSKRKLLLSMLGVALSPAARSYLKLNDQGLKHFLAQFPREFSVEGGKGSEYVTYTPIALSEALDDISGPPSSTGGPSDTRANGISGSAGTLPYSITVSGAAAAAAVAAHEDLTASPTRKPAAAPSVEPTPSGTGTCGLHGLKTPSLWNSPYDPYGNPIQPDPTAAAAAGIAQNWPQPSSNIWPTNENGTSVAPCSGATCGGGAAATNTTNWNPAGPWHVPPGNPMWTGWWNQFPPFAVGGQPTDFSAMAAAFPGLPPLGPGTAPAATISAETQPPAINGDAGTATTAGTSTAAGVTVAPSQPSVPATSSSEDTSQGAAVRLRGLPFTAREQDVFAFFSQHDMVDCIADGPKAVNFMLRSNGRPSGQAVVQMRCRADAELTLQVLSGQYMGNRYIEVFLHNGDTTNHSSQPPSLALATQVPKPGESGVGTAGQPAGATAQGNPPPKIAAEMTQPSAMHTMLQTAMQGGMVPPYVPPVAASWNAPIWGPPMPQTSPALGIGGSGADGTNDAAWEALFQFLGPESRAIVAGQGVPQGPATTAAAEAVAE